MIDRTPISAAELRDAMRQDIRDLKDQVALITAERDRYKAALGALRVEAERAADMFLNGESTLRVFCVLDKALAALSPTPPTEGQ